MKTCMELDIKLCGPCEINRNSPTKPPHLCYIQLYYNGISKYDNNKDKIYGVILHSNLRHRGGENYLPYYLEAVKLFNPEIHSWIQKVMVLM